MQYILDSTVDSLVDNPNRKFIEVEMAFFSRWWNEQTEAKKAQVRQLVANRQLVFVNGGWCMNDEAVPTYWGIIDQMTLGHQFILHEFGEAAAPKSAWSIDPFGHASTSVQIWNLTGFDHYVINRIDYRHKDQMKAQAGLEFTWKGSKSSDVSMWIHMLDNQ